MDINTLFKISYGLYVISSTYEGKSSGFVANALMQVTATPARLIVASSKDNYTSELIEKSQVLAISVLSQDVPNTVISTFGYKSGKDMDKFADFKHEKTASGVPYLSENVMAFFDCKVTEKLDMGSHWLFLCDVDDAQVLNETALPLTYHYFRNVMKGKAPKSAPTYVEDHLINNNKNETIMNEKHVCDVCGYVYDPAAGDPDNGVAAGTSFEQISDDWGCPLCGVDKTQFSKE